MKLKYTRVRGKERLVMEYSDTYVKGLRKLIGEENFAKLSVTGKVSIHQTEPIESVITYEIIKGEAK